MPLRVNEGLARVSKLEPQAGYAEVKGGIKSSWNLNPDWFARAEVGHRISKDSAVFAYGEGDKQGWQAGLGLRVTW